MTTVSVSNSNFENVVLRVTAVFGCCSVRENYSAYLAQLYLHWFVNFKSRVVEFVWNVTCSFTAKKVFVRDIFHSSEK